MTIAADHASTSESEISAEPDRARMMRALRDLEASQARVERDAQRINAETQSKLVAELLPVLDGLDRAIRAARDARTASALVQGVRLVRAQLESVLRGYGVTRIDASTAFDPSVHEAVSVAPVSDSAQNGMVLEELEPGYRFGDRLLRPAKVVVGRLLTSAD
ncbi:MAG: nucleotide exchange factor GrpE [Kofleriaceae bacterium]